MKPSPNQFSVERLEARLVLSSVTPITFDPEGTLVKRVGTVNGVKFIQLSGGGGSVDVFGVPVPKGGSVGKARVFATDLDADNFIDPDEITGIALSDNAKAVIFGSINGDIVTNLKGADLSGDAKDGSTLLSDSIHQITVKGNVLGDIICGRSMNKISIEGSVDHLIVGTAASGVSFQFHGPSGASVVLDPFTLGANSAGKGINQASITGDVQGLLASDGGASADGGAISRVKILSDSEDVTIQAGNAGGSPDRAGGHGGDILSIEIHSTAGVTLIAGNGSDSDKTGSIGGDGGSISKAKINTVGAVNLTAGDAGLDTASNAGGGLGGSIGKVSVNSSACNVTAGQGGDGATEGGDGGSINGIKGILSGAANFFAGEGGAASVDAGIGGGVRSLKLVAGTDSAFIRAIVAGNGGDGSVTNGDGGSISSINFDGDIGDFNSSYGVAGMGGLFAGRSGANGFAFQADNGDVTKINADRVAAIVAGTDLTDSAPKVVRTIHSVKANEIGANFDSDVDSIGATEPAFDYFETIAPTDQYNLGEVPIDGPVLAFQVGGLSRNPLFLFVASANHQSGNLDPHVS